MAVALTKIDGEPSGPLGAVVRTCTDPAWSWYTATGVADAETFVFSAWTGPNLRDAIIIPNTTTESAIVDFALSGSTLTLTFQTDGSITSGAFVGLMR